MKFIKLTKSVKVAEKFIYIDADKIQAIEFYEGQYNHTHTDVYMVGGNVFAVKELPEKIITLIGERSRKEVAE